MADSKGFYFDKVRAVADMTERLVIQGYILDGFLDKVRPRAAVFIGSKPARALNVKLEVVKLPPLYTRRRDGNTMSYLAFFYVDMQDVSKRLAETSGAKLVVITENKDRERTLIYKGSLSKLREMVYSFSFNINDAYIHDGKTFIGGWIGGDSSTVIKIEGKKNKKSSSYEEVGIDGSSRVGNEKYAGPLGYQIERAEHREISVFYPEIPETELLGFTLYVEGEYSKLRITMSYGNKSYTKVITTGKSNFELDSSNTIVRYSGKVVRNLKNYGVKETVNKIKLHMYLPVLTQSRRYNKWINNEVPDKDKQDKQRVLQKEFEYRPLLSLLVPLYETEENFLDELIAAVQKQTYDNWEICFSDGSKDSSRLSAIIGRYSEKDSRIKYIAEKKGPLGISENTNQAFKIAVGDFVVLGDHDDLIDPDAFYCTVEAMNQEGGRDIDVIYTDEDKTNAIASRRFEPTIKPKFNQMLLESCNYITHMFVVRSSIVKEVGGFNEKCDGAQDYDFILRCVEKADKVHHINRILYSWRISEKSTAGNPKAKMYAYNSGVTALQGHYDRMGIRAKAEIGDHLGYYHTRYEYEGNPLLYVVIVNSDDEKYKCTVDSIKSKSSFRNIEYIRVDSDDKLTYGHLINRGIDEVLMLAAGDDDTAAEDIYVAFIEAGVTMMGEDELAQMIGALTVRPEISAIGAKVYCGNGTVSHAGVILNTDKVYGYEYMGQSISKDMYFNYSEYSALRRGCTMFRLKTLQDAGELSTEYKGGYSLIDYTLGITTAGGKCVYSANANFLINQSRGIDADKIFEGGDYADDEKLFYDKNPDIRENGDLYYR